MSQTLDMEKQMVKRTAKLGKIGEKLASWVLCAPTVRLFGCNKLAASGLDISYYSTDTHW